MSAAPDPSREAPDATVPGRLDMPAEPASVGPLRARARAFALAVGAGDDVAGDVALAVTEAATNAVLHAFVGRTPGTLSLICEARQGRLRVRVLDDGRGMQPRPDSPGLGLGLSTMGRLASSMDVREGDRDAGTEVALTFAAPGVRGPADALADPRAPALLEGATRLARRAAWPQEGVEQLADLLVGELGDAVTVDLVHDGVLRRLSARVAGDDALSGWLLSALPPSRPGTATWAALQSATAKLTLHDPTTERTPGGPGEVLGLGWWMAVPLTDDDDRPLGLLGLGGRGDRPPPGPGDQALAIEVAARAAGGLVHAQVAEGLRATRQRLERVLAALQEAVTVSGPDGRLVYANEAAARLLGLASADELVGSLPGALAERFQVTDEHGDPVAIEDLPSRRALAGRPAPPLVLRTVDVETGAVRWTRMTASLLEDDDGPLALNIAQDVTAERRAALRQAAAERVGVLLDVPESAAAPVLEAVCGALVPTTADGCALILGGDPVPAATAGLALDDATDTLTVPLRATGADRGTLTLSHGLSGRRFDADDAAFAADLGRRIGLALTARGT